jgi:antitoxin component YwqK of YwqJK toxin-antitoxin module
MHGKWSFWKDMGDPEAEGNFVNGTQVGIWKIWGPDGQAHNVDYSVCRPDTQP